MDNDYRKPRPSLSTPAGSTSKPSRSFVSRNASRASFLPPVGSIAPAIAPSPLRGGCTGPASRPLFASAPRLARRRALAGFGLSAGDSGCRASGASLLLCVTRRPAGVPPPALGSRTVAPHERGRNVPNTVFPCGLGHDTRAERSGSSTAPPTRRSALATARPGRSARSRARCAGQRVV